jgi:heme/copper-type cytochrome/quinol oxidase subunit 4
MGNQKSSPKVNQEGDHDLTIINTQEVHTDFHLSHELKLNIILGLLVVQLVLALYKTLVKRERKRATRIAAKSIANLNEVITQ